MQETETVDQTTREEISLLDLPVARLQIVQAREVVKADWLDRGMVEPVLSQNADGLWVLSLRRQGEHSKFEVPYINSEILLADAELGFVMVLVGYHGSQTEKYGRLGYMTQKGQFYRYYQQQASGEWNRVEWRTFSDEVRAMLIALVEERGPAWARKPGKLRTERATSTKVTMTSYKVVRLIDGRYYSLYKPEIEYVLGQQMKEAAKPKHGGGFYSYPTLQEGTDFLERCVKCIPFGEASPEIALLECEAGGRVVAYSNGKMASTYLRPVRVLEIRRIDLN
jgi:hypothetical protein